MSLSNYKENNANQRDFQYLKENNNIREYENTSSQGGIKRYTYNYQSSD